MDSGEGWRLGHRPGLDGLRGIAVLLVVATHTTAFLLPAGAPAWARLTGAGIGVDVFFVLSGFLITALLLEEHATGGISVGGFYLRRARRLLPAAFTTLGLWCTFRLLVDGVPGREIARSVIVVLTYSTNYYDSTGRQVTLGLGHFWTLALEEQFYFVWPLLLLVLLRGRVSPKVIVGAAVGAAALVVLHRSLVLVDHAGIVAMRADTRCDGLLIGVALGVAMHAGIVTPAQFRRAAWPALVALLAVALLTPTSLLETGWLSAVIAVAVFLAAVLVASALDPSSPLAFVLCAPVLRWVGRLSYSLYLWHVPAIVLVQRHVAGPWGARMAVAVTLSFALAALSHAFVEERFRRHRSGREDFHDGGDVVAAEDAGVQVGR